MIIVHFIFLAVSSTHLKITDKTMENAVYKHLCRQGFKVYTGQLNKGEVDFVAERGNERIYVQVTQLLASEEDINREFGSLKSIRDNHPKYVISPPPFLHNVTRMESLTSPCGSSLKKGLGLDLN